MGVVLFIIVVLIMTLLIVALHNSCANNSKQKEVVKRSDVTANLSDEHLPLTKFNVVNLTIKLNNLFKEYGKDYDTLVWKNYVLDIKDPGTIDRTYISKHYYFNGFNLWLYMNHKLECTLEYTDNYLYPTIFEDNRDVVLDDCYINSHQNCFNFLQDFVNNCIPVASAEFKVGKLRETLATGKKHLGMDCTINSYDSWYLINGGEYYTKDLYVVYKFSDWSEVGATYSESAELRRSYYEAIWNIVDGAMIEKCDDPKKEHWHHFLELEMKEKKRREKDCHSFVDELLKQQQEYNDLQYKYEMLPSAPIVDYDSFINFCKIVHKTIEFKDYEITNYLLSKDIRKH